MIEECRTTMLNDDMNLDILKVYAQLIEESKLRRMARRLKGVVLVIKSSLGLKRGLNNKKNLGVLNSRLIKEVVLRMTSLHVSNVERNIMVSIYWVLVVELVVVMKDTR